ncbi:MAG: indole-3-glycerol phosphate synthase TrpC [Elusimicrobiota bacterium]|nr:indole-3-glycerol phosphate synthase TrpC [Elusimicrobiota bacterium]
MILDEIVAASKIRLEQAKKELPLSDLIAQVKALPAKKHPFAFKAALAAPELSFICEIKKASPSKGLISPDFRYLEIALEYQKAGASAISVLTETEFFLGSPQYLKDVKKFVKIPVLRKDFIFDPYQVYETAVLGADAMLLICSILDEGQLKELYELAGSLGISCLLEAHDESEIKKALFAGAEIVGVNNRNLNDFSVDLKNSLRLRELVPAGKIFVSESGIKTAADIELLRQHKVDAVLIGEELMKTDNIRDIGSKIKLLRG